jgi:hypothetical protein
MYSALLLGVSELIRPIEFSVTVEEEGLKSSCLLVSEICSYSRLHSDLFDS